jgi:hypothetical protein
MSSLVHTVDAIRKREQAEAWDRNETQLATSLSTVLPAKSELDDETRALVRPFLDYCALVNVRYLPAKPTTVAAFVFKQFDSGVTPETILDQVSAIEALHDSFDSIANPVQTSPVRFALSEVTVIEPPRSWTKEQQAEFKTFPISAQKTIAAREKNREQHLRQKQNELAELKKALRLTAAAEPKTADTTERQ